MDHAPAPTRDQRRPELDEFDGDQLVVLLDGRGAPCGQASKRDVHTRDTRLHLAMSIYVLDPSGRVLITQRSMRKRTWPGVWTNSCCGHPMPGESLREAVERRLFQELGLRVRRVALAFPDFAYRASMDDGTMEHELCPVVVVEAEGEPHLDADEVADARWVSWSQFTALAAMEPAVLSPWAVAQTARFVETGAPPGAWLDGRRPDRLRSSQLSWPDLDRSTDQRADGEPREFDTSMVRDGVERVLLTFLDRMQSDLIDIDEHAAPVFDVIDALVRSGGKRLRPAFVYWGHRSGGTDHDDALFTVGAAVELLHTFALVHDDVMDRSATRRSQPTAHTALTALHDKSGWTGDQEWFGISSAILAGDLAHVWAQQIFDEALVTVAAHARAREPFRLLQAEVMVGQYLDLRLAVRPSSECPEAAIAEARRVALLKSGRYTVTRPLQLGAALAGVDDRVARCLERYGDALGVAFQLRDDALGLMGDSSRTGKSCSDDLREGKRTTLVLRTLARTSGTERALVLGALGNPALDDATCDRVRDITVASGALAETEDEIEALLAVALAAASELSPPASHALVELAHLAAHRTS